MTSDPDYTQAPDLVSPEMFIQLEESTSINKIYSVFHGRKVLSSAGKRFKNHASQQLFQELLKAPRFEHNRATHVTIRYGIPSIFNKTWNKKNGTTERFRRVDLDNMPKLLLDVLKEGLGFDDSQFCSIHLQKVYAPSHCAWITVAQTRNLELDTLTGPVSQRVPSAQGN